MKALPQVREIDLQKDEVCLEANRRFFGNQDCVHVAKIHWKSHPVPLYILTLILLVMANVSMAQENAPEKVVCSAVVIALNYEKIQSLPTGNDKLIHCTVSCAAARYCPMTEVLALGFAKEIADALGLGEPEWADIVANMHGVLLAKKAKSFEHCQKLCAVQYP